MSNSHALKAYGSLDCLAPLHSYIVSVLFTGPPYLHLIFIEKILPLVTITILHGFKRRTGRVVGGGCMVGAQA